MISYSETKKFYETTPAWDDDIYGQFTPCYFTNFIKNELKQGNMQLVNVGENFREVLEATNLDVAFGLV